MASSGKEGRRQVTYRTIGVLGGMGPAAGVHFARLLIDLNSSANHDAGHVPFILSSNPRLPSRVDAYLRGGANPASSIAASLQALHEQGADVGVVVCNTAHIYFDDIVRRTTLPLINMVENTASHVGKSSDDRGPVGLLATTATVKSRLYATALEARGVRVIVPNEADQEAVSAAIFDSEYGIKATGCSPSERAYRTITTVAKKMKELAGIEQLLLGCTELSLAIRSDTCEGLHVIDPVKILAQTCLRYAGIVTTHEDAAATTTA